MLNKKDFITIAGNVEELDKEITDRCDRAANLASALPVSSLRVRNDELCCVQREQRSRGRLGIEFHHTINGYTWRDTSGLSGWAIRWRGKSIADAISFAKKWVDSDNTKREAYIRVSTAQEIASDEETKLFAPSELDRAYASGLLDAHNN